MRGPGAAAPAPGSASGTGGASRAAPPHTGVIAFRRRNGLTGAADAALGGSYRLGST